MTVQTRSEQKFDAEKMRRLVGLLGRIERLILQSVRHINEALRGERAKLLGLIRRARKICEDILSKEAGE